MIVVKRHGHTEKFDERKVYASVYAACLNSHMDEKKSENIAEDVCDEIKVWIKTRREFDSKEIAEKINFHLEKRNKDAAFLYKTHLDLS